MRRPHRPKAVHSLYKIMYNDTLLRWQLLALGMAWSLGPNAILSDNLGCGVECMLGPTVLERGSQSAPWQLKGIVTFLDGSSQP